MIAGSAGREEGSAVAELAVVLPAVVLVLLLGLGAAAAGVRQVALQDVVADAARLLGRGEDRAVAAAAVSRTDATARLHVQRTGGLVCAVVESDVGIGGRVVLPLRARGCALDGGR